MVGGAREDRKAFVRNLEDLPRRSSKTPSLYRKAIVFISYCCCSDPKKRRTLVVLPTKFKAQQQVESVSEL